MKRLITTLALCLLTAGCSATDGSDESQGQEIEFGAIDIQRVGDSLIVEDWHLEDNLVFMQQAGLIDTAVRQNN